MTSKTRFPEYRNSPFMGRFGIAFRAFFRILFDAEITRQIADVLSGRTLPSTPSETVATAPPPVQPAPSAKSQVQNDALTLLSALQREARLIDFLQEDLSDYADEQIGAAVREVQRDSRQLLQRYFAPQPVVTASEGDAVEVPAGFDAGRFRLTGNVSGSAPYHGTLQHHGWEATKCELPSYTGSAAAARVIAPAEVEIG